MKLFTIGHGNLDIEPFLELLKANDVRWVADVRSAPYSRMFPWFNKNELAQALDDAGIKYLFLGEKLGGKPREGEADGEWVQGKLNPGLVSQLSHTPRWAEGLAYLAGVVTSLDEDNETGCLMCSEKDPNNCHRSLIAFDLQAVVPGLSVLHLDHDATLRDVRFQNVLFEVSDDRNHYH
jgi:uncharacterized protein (DUF488 family)